MRIWLIRHGLTALGEEKRYQGSTDTPLSDAGRLALQPDDRFARVFCSPLLRAAETAEILFPSAEKRMIPDLREMNFGAFEGRGYSAIVYSISVSPEGGQELVNETVRQLKELSKDD